MLASKCYDLVCSSFFGCFQNCLFISSVGSVISQWPNQMRVTSPAGHNWCRSFWYKDKSCSANMENALCENVHHSEKPLSSCFSELQRHVKIFTYSKREWCVKVNITFTLNCLQWCHHVGNPNWPLADITSPRKKIKRRGDGPETGANGRANKLPTRWGRDIWDGLTKNPKNTMPTSKNIYEQIFSNTVLTRTITSLFWDLPSEITPSPRNSMFSYLFLPPYGIPLETFPN